MVRYSRARENFEKFATTLPQGVWNALYMGKWGAVVDAETVVAMPPLWHVLCKKLGKNEVFHDLWFVRHFLGENDAVSSRKWRTFSGQVTQKVGKCVSLCWRVCLFMIESASVCVDVSWIWYLKHEKIETPKCDASSIVTVSRAMTQYDCYFCCFELALGDKLQ